MKILNNLKTKNILACLIFPVLLMLQSCATFNDGGAESDPRNVDVLDIPFLKNSPNECYYLDEFMPVPNNMVTGQTGSLSLRYYTYEQAAFKDWTEAKIILSFYSDDNRCWSLFEEYYIGPEHNAG